MPAFSQTDHSLHIKATHLPDTVSTVDEEVSTGGVGRGVRCEVDVGTLELLGVTVTTHWDHGLPEVLGLLVDEVGETGVNVTGRDGVDTGKVAPLVGEGASHVDATSLGDVVGSLLLWEVGNVSGHGGSDDKGASAALLEVVTDGLGAVEGTVQVGLDNLVPCLDGTVKDTRVGGAASVGNEGVDLAKVGNDILDELLAVLVATNVELVCLALDTVGLGELLGVLVSTVWAGGVGDSNIGAHLSTTAGGLDTHTSWSGGTSDDDDLALHGQKVHELLWLWD